MTDGTYDPALFGAWATRCTYGEALSLEQVPFDDAFRLILDRKSADMPAGEELADMLNGMTRELREQMQMFQMLRQQTDRRQTEAGEEIDRKAAQADAKASIEAMSLIVRTLEKIDSLQRTLAQDRERRDAEALDDAGYQNLLDTLEALVEQRAVERCRERDVVRAQDGGERDRATGAGCAAGAVALAGDGSVPAASRSGNPLAPTG
ncbi:hypothetical protein [Rhizobium sp. 9140]|uniref:hypothetical protein n=1 Tax=Rhizobium sp. 9140 TaxID=1761900 RepID=UPI00079880A7|nr:hypothetical protein [Rhizobium sp. 9140]CZT34554.1 hypothetical protein GA0004734_00015710 [Rhizobium sp. 9140]